VNNVLIVGGGIAGLATAYELHRRGVPFILLESAARPGGVILSEQVDGFTIDAGPDSLLVQKPDAIRLCEELGIASRLIATSPPRQAFIQRGGRLHPLPAASVLSIPTRIGPFIRTSLFSWPGKLRMGAELFIPPRHDQGDESIGDFMRRRFGAEAAEYLAEPLLAGIHAGDVDRLSIRALFPRFTDAERKYGSLIRAFRAQSRSPAPTRPEGSDVNASASGGGAPRGLEDEGPFRSLPGGLSELVRALVGALPRSSICLNTPAERVLLDPAAPPDGSRFRVETGSREALRAQAVVLATPAFVTAKLTRHSNADLAALCDEVPYASTATIALAFPRTAVGHPLNGSGFVVPRAEPTGILAASWLSSKWPHRAPAERVLLRAFAGGARDPKGLERTDDELVALTMHALGPLLDIRGEPLLTRVYRWERANAQHEIGHLARLERIERTLAGQAGLFVTGSGFRGVGIPDCVADGRATGARVADWLARSASGSTVRPVARPG
jgi:oxygen-dependent protoporphyrinogen oxidase